MYRIRNFGNDRWCDSLDTLKTTLVEEYRGKSVSVEYPGPGGFRGIAFIDVTEKGEIRETYGRHRRFDLSELAVWSAA